MNSRKIIRGVSAINPVDIDKEYLDIAVDYTIKHGFDHFQFIGPIHNPVRGNIDGMTLSRKYAKFNDERDLEYVKLNMELVNSALDKLNAAGVKSYMWHHELDLPTDFSKEFPEILNENGDVEVTHPLVKDYLENRIIDFFYAYPKMDGLILTLHETKIPLLKLKNQKLDKIGRVKYVTEILYKSCKALGKELVVRPFASIPEDYAMMLEAYESISKDLIVMDKWTQFDWSLTLPHNQFFYQIKNNPLFVETDIFGEYFGKGLLPIMLKDHIKEKFEYCEQFLPIGYVNRIDRGGNHPFGTVNEVNLEIMHALMSGDDVDAVIDEFFKREYPEVADELKEIMSVTEQVNRSLLNNKDYYFMQGSFFPELNHSKNHFYFEMMKKDYCIASGEWFIPKNWVRGDIQGIIDEKQWVLDTSTDLLAKVKAMNGKVEEKRYQSLLMQFNNLYYASRAWRILVDVFIDYVKYFETGDGAYETKFYSDVDALIEVDKQGKAEIGDTLQYYMNNYIFDGARVVSSVEIFAREVKESFQSEKQTYFDLKAQDNTDFINCGGAMESHKLQKEVNFSDTMLIKGRLCRIPGNRRGVEWSQINGHGWFSYEIAVREGEENQLIFELGSLTERLDVKITAGETEYVVKEPAPNGIKTYAFKYLAKKGEDKIRIRIDRISPYTPMIYSIISK